MRVIDSRTKKEIRVHEKVPGTEVTLYAVAEDFSYAVLEYPNHTLVRADLKKKFCRNMYLLK